MTQRRRFFPVRQVQAIPGNTVELAVQLRKLPTLDAPEPAGAPWVSWLPVVGRAPYFGGYNVSLDAGLVRYETQGTPNPRSFWFEGDAPLLYTPWPDVPNVIGPPGFERALPIAQEGWRCTRIDDTLADGGFSQGVATDRQVDSGAVYQGVVMGTPAGADITWELTWDAAPYVGAFNKIPVLTNDSPGYAASRSGHTASATGPLLTVCTAYYYTPEGIELPEETLTAIASVNGQEVGRLVIHLQAIYF